MSARVREALQDDPVAALVERAAGGDVTAERALPGALSLQAAQREAKRRIADEQARRKTLAEQAAEAVKVKAEQERGAAIVGQRRTIAHGLEIDLAAGVLSLSKMRDLLALAREEYTLTQSRAALATEERVLDWLVVRLGLPTPWVIPKARQRMTLAQALGLDPLNAPTEGR